MSKVKAITISEQNIHNIYSKIRKFFYNNNHTNFESWHTFGGGFQKRIRKTIYINDKKVNTSRNYPRPLSIKLKKRKSEEEYIHVLLTETSTLCLSFGDTIAFLGNRIIIKQKWWWHSSEDGDKYIYTTFQVKPDGISIE